MEKIRTIISLSAAAFFAGVLLWYLCREPVCMVLASVRKGWFSPLVCGAFAVGMIQYAATKGFIGSVTFPYTNPERRYITDTGSYVTNDYVHVSISTFLVPSGAPFLGYVRPVGSTNDADWVEFYSTTFGDFHSPSNIPYAGAISNDFQFFTTWTPGPVIHTNGVATIMWNRPEGATNFAAIVNTTITTNGIPITIKGIIE